MNEYEIQEQAAQYTIDPIQIDHVTSENIADKMAEKNIETLMDVNGNPIGYYADTVMSVSEPGKFTTSQKTQVFLVPEKNPNSTQDNIILDFKVIPREQGDNVLPGGQVIYRASQDAATDTLKAAGYNVNMPDEAWNNFWEEYYLEEETDGFLMRGAKSLIDSFTGVPGSGDILDAFKGRSDYAMAVMRMADVGGVKMPWVGNEDIAIARLLKTAAKFGLTDAGEIFEDDPATQLLFRTGVEVGDDVHLTPVGNRDGSVFDSQWVEAFIKPMTMAFMVNPSRDFPSDDQWEEGYNTFASGYTKLIPYQIDENVYNAVNKHVNIWAALYGTNIYTGNKDGVRLWGSYIDESINWRVTENYPETRGYAILVPSGTFYNQLMQGRGYYSNDWHGGGTDTRYPFMLIYDQEMFANYLDSIGVNDSSQLLNNTLILFCNGSVKQKNPYSEKTRPDAMTITVNSSVADIIHQIETDPVWPDNKITVPQYDPATDTTINHYYYPITPGVDDPRQINWPDIQLPDIVNPINDVVKWPTIPSQVSLPVDNDPVTPTAGSNRFWTIYNPSDGQMQALGAELWDQTAIQILKQTFVNPTDGIITWQQVFLPVTQAYQDFIYLGDYKTGVDHVPVITQQKVFKEFGIITIPRYFNDYRDYTETEVSMYLPFIGYVDIDPRDAIGCDLSLRYSMDVITGTCVATISPKVGDNAECCYMFTGNCAVQLPITAADRSRMLSGLISGASNGFSAGGKVGGLFGGGAGAGVGSGVGAVLGGALGAVSGYFGGVQKSNGFSANAGALTIYKKPFVIIHRSIPADPLLFDSYYGNPASVTATLKNLHGFTRVRECYIDIPTATDTEKQMIESYLKTGVILP